MNGTDLVNLYFTDKDFRDYVDKYTEQRKLNQSTSLSHKLVNNVAEYYAEKGENINEG